MKLSLRKRGESIVRPLYLKIMTRDADRVEGCVRWRGPVSSASRKGTGEGYPTITDKGKTYRVHRVVWEAWFGPILPGWVIDHACHNFAAERGECDGGPACPHRRCYNIHHLRMVPHHGNQAASPVTATGKALRPVPERVTVAAPERVPVSYADALREPVQRREPPAVLTYVSAVFDDWPDEDTLPSRIILRHFPAGTTLKQLGRWMTLCGVRNVQNILWDGKRCRGYSRAGLETAKAREEWSPRAFDWRP